MWELSFLPSSNGGFIIKHRGLTWVDMAWNIFERGTRPKKYHHPEVDRVRMNMEFGERYSHFLDDEIYIFIYSRMTIDRNWM